MRKILISLAVIICIVSLSARASRSADASKVTKIGFSELSIQDPWRIAQVDSMQAEAKNHGYTMIVTNAEQKAEKQISDVEDLLAQGVDFLFIAPMDIEAIVPALDAARARNVPVILLDRQAKGVWPEDFLTTIIADYKKQGRECARWAGRKLAGKDKIRVVEISGKVGGSDQRDRAAGFREGVAEFPNMEIVTSQNGFWSRAESQKAMQNVIQSLNGRFDVVYTHNDEMGLGVALALKAAGLRVNEDCFVISIDGQREAVEAILNDEMSATFTCNPRFGPAAFAALEKYIAGEQLPEFIINDEYMIDASNAEEKLADAF